jgi:hypothetical protein
MLKMRTTVEHRLNNRSEIVIIDNYLLIATLLFIKVTTIFLSIYASTVGPRNANSFQAAPQLLH